MGEGRRAGRDIRHRPPEPRPRLFSGGKRPAAGRGVELLGSHHFHVGEGGGEIHGVYVDAHLGRGQRRLAEGKAGQALQDFQAALEYPENLEGGKPAAGGRDPEVYYFIGTALDSIGEREKSREAFRRSAEVMAGPSESTYYQGR